jgi:hypothetical protein
MNIKIDPLDTLCSKIVRLRANGVCQIGGERKEYNRLMACHCFGRGNKRVRYDLDNMVAGCLGHHQQMDADPEMKIEVFTKQLGLLGYTDLKRRAYWENLKKPDYKLIKMFLQKELEKYVD